MLKYIRKAFLLTGLSFLLLLIFSSLAVFFSTKSFIYKNVEEIPKTKSALILGTNKYLKGGGENAFYRSRIEKASELYFSGKVKYLIVSGNNPSVYYNEPLEMTKDLIKLGVNEKVIIADYAGKRTLDSVLRAKEIFGQKKIIIVSQAFHLPRALFIAKINGLEAYGLVAPDPSSLLAGAKIQTREALARIKLLYDIFFQVPPKFLGEKIILE